MESVIMAAEFLGVYITKYYQYAKNINNWNIKVFIRFKLFPFYLYISLLHIGVDARNEQGLK